MSLKNKLFDEISIFKAPKIIGRGKSYSDDLEFFDLNSIIDIKTPKYEILGEDIFPYPVRLNEDQPGVLIRHWTAVTANSNANISYAIQWFVFASAIVIVSLFTSSNIVSVLRKKEAP